MRPSSTRSTFRSAVTPSVRSGGRSASRPWRDFGITKTFWSCVQKPRPKCAAERRNTRWRRSGSLFRPPGAPFSRGRIATPTLAAHLSSGTHTTLKASTLAHADARLGSGAVSSHHHVLFRGTPGFARSRAVQGCCRRSSSRRVGGSAWPVGFGFATGFASASS